MREYYLLIFVIVRFRGFRIPVCSAEASDVEYFSRPTSQTIAQAKVMHVARHCPQKSYKPHNRMKTDGFIDRQETLK